jgi:hypothetical protein
MMYGIEMASCGMIFLLSLMKVGKGVEVILTFCLRNLNGCNVGVSTYG